MNTAARESFSPFRRYPRITIAARPQLFFQRVGILESPFKKRCCQAGEEKEEEKKKTKEDTKRDPLYSSVSTRMYYESKFRVSTSVKCPRRTNRRLHRDAPLRFVACPPGGSVSPMRSIQDDELESESQRLQTGAIYVLIRNVNWSRVGFSNA